MYCPKCGHKISDEARFCPSCGYKIQKEFEDDKTKEINIEILKKVEQIPTYTFNKKEEQNHNSIIFSFCTIIVLLLVIALLIVNNNKKSYINIEPKQSYCNESYDENLCGVEEKEKIETTEFNSLDFTKYDFSETSSKEAFYNSIVNILNEKSIEGNKYCNNQSYADATNKLNTTLNANYSYLCDIDVTYLDNLISRLNEFYKLNNINAKIVDSYVVGRGGRNEYANYTGETIGSNSTYIAYLRRVHMSINMFSDYDKLTKSYERDLEGGFHPINSKPEDIIVHETAHAVDFYITATRNGIDSLVIDDFNKYNQLYNSWGKQLYSEEVVKKAVERVNNKYKTSGLATKTELELRQEISGYAASSQNGTIMYAETFAEALVDYLSNGNNAKDLSIEIYKIVQEDLANL